MQVHVSPEINHLLDAAAALSVRRGQFFVGVEHLLAALLDESGRLPRPVSEEWEKPLHTVLRDLEREGWSGPAPSTTGEVFYTPRCANTINAAARAAERFRTGPAQAGHLLLALMADAHAGPARTMDRLGYVRADLLNLLREELVGGKGSGSRPRPVRDEGGAAQASASQEPVGGAAARTAVEEAHAQTDPEKAPFSLKTVTHDLTQDARDGKIEGTVGRDAEVFEIIQILARKTKNNVILVGEAGVGKTKVVEGLAVAATNPQSGMDDILAAYRILELNISALMAGTAYRGAFEEKMIALLDELKKSSDIILFIDEIHLIMGAGATEGSNVDVANLLKPPLARGEIRCIGATTMREYRKFVEKDPAIERRFQMVRIEELSADATVEVLNKLRPSLQAHHGVRIGTKALHAAVNLTQRYMPNRNLPDKAIDVLDQACARYRLKAIAAKTNPKMLEGTLLPTAVDKVTPHDIRKVVSQITTIPIEELTAEQRRNLGDMDRHLRQRLIGQDEAVSKVVAAIKKSRAGLADPNRPDAVMLFMGSSGVGKTHLAKLLADALFGSSNHLITFDMSEYIEEHSVSRLLGAPPGYVGSEEDGRLSNAVRSAPFSILLFDEIEKAHPRIFDIFLPIFDEGRLKDNQGRNIDFRNCVIILTTNIGADRLMGAPAEDGNTDLMMELRGHFRPEFINRIDEIIPFYPLLFEDVRSILRLAINDVRGRLKSKRIGIRMYQQAYEYLAEQGYSAEYGARELRRVVERLVATPISGFILAGEFNAGDMIDVKVENGKLCFEKGPPHSRGRDTV